MRRGSRACASKQRARLMDDAQEEWGIRILRLTFAIHAASRKSCVLCICGTCGAYRPIWIIRANETYVRGPRDNGRVLQN